jgi:hypothetical protein
MTVSFLFGWEHVVTALLLVIVVAVAFFVIAAAGRNASELAEFEALLEARSNGRGEFGTPAAAGGSRPSTEAGPATS